VTGSWSFVAIARLTVWRLGLDELETRLRNLARSDAQKSERAIEVLGALAICRRELEADPCIGPLPQSQVAFGQALADLAACPRRPVNIDDAMTPVQTGPAARRMSGLTLSIIRLGATVAYDLASERPPSQARREVLDAAHALELDDPALDDPAEVDRRITRLFRASNDLEEFGLWGLWTMERLRHAPR